MDINLTKADLVEFGNYLFSNERKESMKKTKNVPPLSGRLKEVTDADLDKFLELKRLSKV